MVRHFQPVSGVFCEVGEEEGEEEEEEERREALLKETR